jgi:Leucine-rich repeat (LRR) protein
LSHLYLANNQIRRIESYAFAGTSSIRLLVLTNNPTVRIDSSAFAGKN